MFLYSRVDSTLGCGEHTIYALTAHRVGSGFQVTVTGLDARVPVTSYRFGRVGSSSQEVAGLGAGSSLQLQFAGLGAQVPLRGYRFRRAGSSLQITGFGARVPVTSYRSGRVGSS